MPETVFLRIQMLLTEQGIDFEVLRHEPVYTSEQAAAVRGTSLASGAKALVCMADRSPLMIVLPADLKLASRQIRRAEHIKSFRFANAEEVAALTGLVAGSIPPFGSLFNMPTLCDERLSKQATINFNAGDHAISICMSSADYLAVEQPRLGVLSCNCNDESQ